MGRGAEPKRQRQGDDGQRSPSRVEHTGHVVPEPPQSEARQAGCGRQQLPRRTFCYAGAESPHHLGRHGESDGRNRHLPGTGCPGPELTQRPQHDLPRQPGTAAADTADVSLQPAGRRGGQSRTCAARRRRGQRVHSGRHADRAATQQRSDHQYRPGDRRCAQRAVHGLQCHARV